MKSFVVITYYHLLHSIALALTLEEKPALYFETNYLKVGDDLLNRIRETRVFKEVREIPNNKGLSAFFDELSKTRNYTDEEIDRIGITLFEKYLEPYYSEVFRNADTNDTIYIHNDCTLYYYYIHKHFKEIVGVEDGYGSLKQQLQLLDFKGRSLPLKRFVGKYFPEPLYGSPKVKKIISSCKYEDIPKKYTDKLEILDFLDLINSNREKFKRIAFQIFELSDLNEMTGGVLFLGQPLSRCKYCNSLEEYLITRKYIHSEVSNGHSIYYKGHPAETIPGSVYGIGTVNVLPKAFPVELLNFLNLEFEKVLSFGSTGSRALNCARINEKLFENEKADSTQINKYIVSETKEEAIIFDFYFIIRTLSLESYINVYSCLLKRARLNQRVHVLVKEENREKALQFFSPSNLESNVYEYLSQASEGGTCPWNKEFRQLLDRKKELSTPRVLTCNNLNSDDLILKSIGKVHNDYDYLMVVEENNLMFSPLNRIWKDLKKNIRSGIIFQRQSKIINNKGIHQIVPLSTPFVDKSFSAEIPNRVWHRSVIEKMLAVPDCMRQLVISKGDYSFTKKMKWELFIPPEKIVSIDNGLKFFVNRTNDIISYCEEEEVTNQIALELNKYIDWCMLFKNKLEDNDIADFLDSINTTDDLRLKSLSLLLLENSHEKRSRFIKDYKQDNESNNSSHSAQRKKDSKGKAKSIRKEWKEWLKRIVRI